MTKRRRAEFIQKGNPHKLTLRQHVLPKRSIERFLGEDGCVSVLFKNRPSVSGPKRVKPKDPLFCADRVWDQQSEIGWKRRIEDPFQKLADRITSGETSSINLKDKDIIDSFYALWEARAFFRDNPPQDIPLNGVWVERSLTKDEQEFLEKNYITVVRQDLMLSGRHVANFEIEKRILHSLQVLANINWTIVRSNQWEFFVPDYPYDPIVPISPTISLIAQHTKSLLQKEEVGWINGLVFNNANSYIFAKDFTEEAISCR